MYAVPRKADAEILYNQKPKPKKKYRYPYKAKSKTDDESESVLSHSSRRRKVRRGLALLDITDTTAKTFSSSTSLSSLASMSIDDISVMKDDHELEIEYSSFAKNTKQKIEEFKKKKGEEAKRNTEGEIIVYVRDLYRTSQQHMLLTEKTLIYILYSALNICKSRIQFGDLLRMTRERHISFYNFLVHIPENQRDRLSLLQGNTKTYFLKLFIINF